MKSEEKKAKKEELTDKEAETVTGGYALLKNGNDAVHTGDSVVVEDNPIDTLIKKQKTIIGNN